MPVFLETTENMIERIAMSHHPAVRSIPLTVYNIGIDGVKMAFRPTEQLRRYDQSHSGGGC